MNDQQRAAMQIDSWERRLDIKYPDAVFLTPAMIQEVMQAEINDLREALAQPQGHSEQHLNMVQGDWVDLTDDELETLFRDSIGNHVFNFANEVIAKFKSKNTPPVVPKNEPVAWGVEDPTCDYVVFQVKLHAEQFADSWGCVVEPLYTTPPSSQRADALVEAAIEATKEKAAKLCEEKTLRERMEMSRFMKDETIRPCKCAAAIRSMK